MHTMSCSSGLSEVSPRESGAASGNLAEAIGDIFASLPSRLPRQADSRPTSPIRDPSHALISKMTIKDINGSKFIDGGELWVVYVFEHPTKGKVALEKWVREGALGHDLRRRALREGETWSKLKHPNVLPFLGVLETLTDLYLVSPYAKNGTIDVYIHLHPDVDRQRLLSEAAAGVAFLHRHGIVHGLIQASSILVSDDIHALLCNFGVARSVTAVTSTGLQGVGTVRFQSPELLGEGGGKTFASDAWAFGMTICEVLSGRVPFHNYASPTAVIVAVFMRDERPPTFPASSLSGVSYDRLWKVAQGCWQRDPAERRSMLEARDRLVEGLNNVEPFKARRRTQPSVFPVVPPSLSEPSEAGLYETDYFIQSDPPGLCLDVNVRTINPSKKCGGGGFGTVYVLSHASAGRAAVKSLICFSQSSEMDELFRRASREAKIWAAAKHPNVLPFWGIIRDVCGLYLVSPYVRNGALTDYIGCHADADRPRLICETASALAHIHGLGIIHGDIKGNNILVSDDAHALVCDFGLSRQVLHATSNALKGCGSMRWQSPELFDEMTSKSFKSDAWAFGMTIYEILSGSLPFYDLTDIGPLLRAICLTDKRPPMEPARSSSGASYAVLWEVTGELWAKDLDRRLTIEAGYVRLSAAFQTMSS